MHAARRLLTVISLIATSLILPGAPASAVTPGISGRMAYVEYSNIWVVDPIYPGMAVNVTGSPSIVTNVSPTWSPDGSKIAFLSDRDRPQTGGFDIYVMNPDGTGIVRRTTDGGAKSDLAWSPTGSTFIYDVVSDTAVKVLLPGQSSPYSINTWPYIPSDLDWSPDGTQFAFSGYDVNAHERTIQTRKVDGSGAATAITHPTGTSTPADDSYPSWSPDGTTLIFRYRDGKIDKAPANGSGSPTPVFTPRQSETVYYPSWSPDGHRIMFNGAAAYIWTIAPDGTDARSVINSNVTLDKRASWGSTVPGAFTSVNPHRLLDTRNGIGTAQGQVGAGKTVTFQVGDNGIVPSGASAAVLNVTVTKGTKPGVITAYPAGIAKPTASNISFAAGQTIATHTTVKLGTGTSAGKVTLYNSSTAPVDLIGDVLGWYQAGTVTAPGMFTPVVPGRLANLASAGPNGTVPVAVSGKAGVPAAASVGAGAFNVTVTAPTKPGYITAFPNGTSRPNASNVNFLAGQTIANAATTKLVNGKLSLFNGSLGTTKLTADVSGWFRSGVAADAGGYVPVNPARILDTRNGIGATKAQVPAGGTVTLTVAGRGGVPASNAGAAVLNVTVTRGTASGYVTAYPAGTARPNASNINFVAGQTIPNLVTVKLGTGGSAGKVTFFNGSTKPVDVLADVSGWYRS